MRKRKEVAMNTDHRNHAQMLHRLSPERLQAMPLRWWERVLMWRYPDKRQ